MKITNYNDGYIRVYKERNKESDFGARKNIKTFDDLEFIVKLAYKECSKRQQDFDFAESRNRTLNIKIKTNSQDIFQKIKETEAALTGLKTGTNSRVIGKMTKWTAPVRIPGKIKII